MYMSQVAASALGSGAGQSLGNEVLAVIQNKVSTTNPNNRASGNASASSNGSVDPSTGNNAANANGTPANGITSPASGSNNQGNNQNSNANNSQNNSQNGSGSGSNNSGTSSNTTNPKNKYSSYSASQNPGSNSSGFFSPGNNSGNINSNLSSNNASQGYSSNNLSDATYGSGNSTPTAKSFHDIAIAFQIQDAGQLADTPINQLTPNISLPTNPYLDFGSQISSQNNSQLSESIFMKAIGLYSRLDVINMLGLEDGLSFSVSNTNGLNSLEKFNYDFGRGVGLGLGIGSLLIPGGIEIDAARLSAAGNTLVNYAKNKIDTTLAPYFLDKLSLFADNTAANPVLNADGRSVVLNNATSGTNIILTRANPQNIMLSQYSVSPNFTNGAPVIDLVNNLLRGSISANEITPIEVVSFNGTLVSLDNRRLVAFNLAGITDIPVQIMSLNDPAIFEEFGDKYNPIMGVGQYAVVVPYAGRTAVEQDLSINGLINSRVNQGVMTYGQ